MLPSLKTTTISAVHHLNGHVTDKGHSYSEPAEGISELIGCLGPPWPPVGPKSSLNEMTVYFNL